MTDRNTMEGASRPDRRRTDSLEGRLISLEITLQKFEEQFVEFRKDFKESKPSLLQLGTFFVAMLGVLLVITGMVGQVAIGEPLRTVQNQITADRSEIKRLSEEQVKHISNGHPETVIQALSLMRTRIDRLENNQLHLLGRTGILEDRPKIGQTPQEKTDGIR
jgi:hypothetical protein